MDTGAIMAIIVIAVGTHRGGLTAPTEGAPRVNFGLGSGS